MTVYARPGAEGSLTNFQARYDNYIGGEWVAPVKGQYFENPTPVTGQAFCEVARSDEADIELALDAAHGAAPAWGKTSPAERAVILNKIADRIEENLEPIAVAESWDNGKPVRETLNADIPLAVDHFRYFAGAIRTQEGSLSQIDDDTVAYHFHEPLGVVGQIIPWNFPILMAGLEAGARPGRGQRRRAQASRADPGVDPVPDVAHRRPAARRGGQCRQRVRRRGGQAAGLVEPDRQDRLYRGDHHRPADHAVRGAEPDPGDAGARREEPEHFLLRRDGRRRRLPGQGARGVHACSR